MAREYDLIVVGAGPAGASCALYAARADLRVLLVDKARFPRDKVCGDWVPRRGLLCLQELGLLERLEAVPHARLSHIRLGAPNGAVATVPFCPQGVEPPGYDAFLCQRRELDALLVDVARACVDVREGFEVLDLLRAGQAVVGVSGRVASGAPEEYRAPVVVGADGHRSIVGRRLGLHRAQPRHQAVALRAYYRDVAGDDAIAEVHFLESISPGYLWLFPVGGGLVNVGLGMLQHELQRRGLSLRRALAEALAQEPLAARFAQAHPQGPLLGWPLPLGSVRRPVCGDGFLLAGDAAGLVNPFTGEGIGNAMWSGRLAARAAAAACAAGDTTATALHTYATQLWQDLGSELRLCHQLQRLGRHHSLLNLVIGRATRRPDVAEWLGRMACGKVSKRSLRSPLTYLRLWAG